MLIMLIHIDNENYKVADHFDDTSDHVDVGDEVDDRGDGKGLQKTVAPSLFNLLNF